MEFSGSNFICKLIDFGKYIILVVIFVFFVGIVFDCYIYIVYLFRVRRIIWKYSRNVVILK